MPVSSEQLIEWSTAAPGVVFGPTFSSNRDADVRFVATTTTYEELAQMLSGASAVFSRLDRFDVDEFVEEGLEEETVTEAVEEFTLREGGSLAGKPYRLTVLWLMGGLLLQWRAHTDEYLQFMVELADIIDTENLSAEDQVRRAAAVVVQNQDYRRVAWRHRASVAREIIKGLGGVPDEIVGDIVNRANTEATDAVVDIEASIYQRIDSIVTDMINTTEWVRATNQEKRKDVAAHVIADRYDGWAVSASVLDILARTARAEQLPSKG